MIYGIGIDCQGIAEVAESLRHFGHRYVARVFAPHEVTRTGVEGRSSEQDLAHLARLFCGKEAVYKALRPPRELSLSWSQIDIGEVSPTTGVGLRGELEQWSRAAGIANVVVSFSSTQTFTLAMAIAEATETAPIDGKSAAFLA